MSKDFEVVTVKDENGNVVKATIVPKNKGKKATQPVQSDSQDQVQDSSTEEE